MEYHKIQTVFLRDPETKYRTLLEGQFALPEFEYLADNKWVFTEKVDGTNVRIIWRNGSIEFGGHDITAHDPADIVQRGLSHVPEGREVFGSLTIEENLMVGTGMHAREGGWRARAAASS